MVQRAVNVARALLHGIGIEDKCSELARLIVVRRFIATGLRIGDKAIGSLRKPDQVPVRITLRCRSRAFSTDQLLQSSLALLSGDLFSCSAAYYEMDHGFWQVPEHGTQDGRIERHGQSVQLGEWIPLKH